MGILNSTLKRPKSQEYTLLDVLYTLTKDPKSSLSPAVECASDTLTYAQLWSVSQMLVDELEMQHGSLGGAVVAVISENHPYILALILGVWTAGGVVTVLDAHAPETLMEGMLSTIGPSYVVLPSADLVNRNIVHSMSEIAWLLSLNLIMSIQS